MFSGHIHRKRGGRLGDHVTDRMPTRLGGFTVDVTERFRWTVTLQEVSRCKGEFLAPLAHGLRNPLAPLRMSLKLMGRRQRATWPQTKPVPYSRRR
ncbi:MAG: hypothetical protein M3294_03760 [Pseudomonadota bacterium]|nr:hypothetical protein [Pseudomonadota bacterium]